MDSYAIAARRIGIILLQPLLIALAIFASVRMEVPIALTIIFLVVIGELIVIFSNLKMRYWFPLLPAYLTAGSIFVLASIDSKNFDLSWILYPSLCLVGIQIAIMIIAAYMEHFPKHEQSKLKSVYDACFKESTVKHENLFKPSRSLIFASILQIIVLVCLILFPFDIDIKTIYLYLAFVLNIIVPIILKIKLRHCTVTIAISLLTLSLILIELDDFGDEMDILLLYLLAMAQLIIVSVYSIVKLGIKYYRFHRNLRAGESDNNNNNYDYEAWNSPSGTNQKAPGEN
jgi:hypothetical protein